MDSGKADASSAKRRCISTACMACRKRKSKCDGAVPRCAACASVYRTECVYDPNSDRRRKGVYGRRQGEQARASESALQAIVHAIVDADDEDEARAVVERIRGAHERNGLEALAKQLAGRRGDLEGLADAEEEEEEEEEEGQLGEVELARNMGELRLEGGVMRFIGGTSHLVYLGDDGLETSRLGPPSSGATPATSWTRVTDDAGVVSRLLDLYFAYHYAYFATLSKDLFWRDFARGRAAVEASATAHCSALLVNVMLALGCHFCDVPAAYATPHDSRTKGDHFFNEAKRILMANDQDELARPRLVTVQALALMSVREAGCAREAKGWVYSGMSFRMAHDIGLNLDVGTGPLVDHAEVDARRITFWGCVLFDSCWSNYLGRLPQLPRTAARVSKFDVVPAEDAQLWRPLTDDDDSAKDKDSSGYAQPGRTRATALHLAALSQISSDLLLMFYHPSHLGRPRGKTAEVKALGDVYRRLEQWRKQLPGEFEPREGQLPHVILMHMFFHLQYIHLFRPFLKYRAASSPLPPHVSPRRICTAHAAAMSKLMRLYKRSYNLRQICNIAVYMTHSACTMHLLNLPDRAARRDLVHGVRHLEEIGQEWVCARRTLGILGAVARRWQCRVPEEAAAVLARADEADVPSPRWGGWSLGQHQHQQQQQQLQQQQHQQQQQQQQQQSNSASTLDSPPEHSPSSTYPGPPPPPPPPAAPTTPTTLSMPPPPPLHLVPPWPSHAIHAAMPAPPLFNPPLVMADWPQPWPLASAPAALFDFAPPLVPGAQGPAEKGLDDLGTCLAGQQAWYSALE